MSRTRANYDPSVAASAEIAGGAAARTFRGRNIEQLLDGIRAELGADAIVLRRREGLTGGIAGFFQRPYVEIDAVAGSPRVDVYDEPPPAPEPSPTAQLAPPAAAVQAEPLTPIATDSSSGTPDAGRPQDNVPRLGERSSASPAFERIATVPRTPFYEREPPGPPRWEASSYVSSQLAALARAAPLSSPLPDPVRQRSPFEALLARAGAGPESSVVVPVSGADAVVEESLSDRREGAPAATAAHTVAPRIAHPNGAVRARITARLRSIGVDEEFAQELIDGAAAHILPLAPRGGIAQAVRAALVQRIPVLPPLPPRGALIALVGPGGAGKTSCCAALLSAYRRSGELPASCASVTRTDGRGQLALLLSPHILRPLALERPRVTAVLRKARGSGLLAIDTPALSPGDRSGMRPLARLLAALEPERVVVALPATLGAVAATQLLQALRPLGVNALALTHADDTDQIGTAVQAACRFGLAPEYRLERVRSGGWRMVRVDPTELAGRLLG